MQVIFYVPNPNVLHGMQRSLLFFLLITLMQLQHKAYQEKRKKYSFSSFYLTFQLGSCGPSHSEIKPEVAAVTPALHSEEQATSMPDPPRAFPPYLRVQIPACSFKSSWVCTLHFFFFSFSIFILKSVGRELGSFLSGELLDHQTLWNSFCWEEKRPSPVVM